MSGQPKKFRFTLTALSEQIQLKNSPSGWDKTIVEFKRSQTYMGVIRSLTVPFNFVFRGAGILRNAFYTKGVSAYIPVLIEKLKSLTYEYAAIFKGKVDFTTFEDNRAFVGASVIEDNFTAKITAFDDVKYQIPIDISADGIQVQLTPLPFKEKADFIFSPTTDFRSDTFFGLQIVNNEQHSTIASVQDVGFFAIVNPDYSTDPHWFYRATIDGNVTIHVNLAFNIGTALTDRVFQIQLVNSAGTILAMLFDQNVHAGGAFTIDTNVVVPITQGNSLYIYFKNVTDDNTNVGFLISSGELNLSYNTQTPPTLCNVLRASYVFDKLIQLMNGQNTGGAYIRQETSSLLLTGLFRSLTITCSNAIRIIVDGTQYEAGDDLFIGATYLVINHNIVYNAVTYTPGQEFKAIEGIDSFTTGDGGSVILIKYQEYLTLSFKDFFQSIYSLMGGNCGFGLDNDIAALEQLGYFFRNLSTLDLGIGINNLKKTPAIDQLYNAIKGGYDDQQYDTLNGFQEVNSTQNYVGDLTVVKKELNLISPIRADAFGIESLRVTPRDSSASRSDNDNFFIWIKDEPEDMDLGIYRPLRSEGWISMTGIDNPESFYNWKLTPKQCLYRGGAFLRSAFDSQTNIRFTNALKNANLVVIDNDGKRVAERDNILISDLDAPIFKPLYFDFDCKLTQDALNQLNIMYTAITFKDRGTNYSGFIIDVSTDTAQNSKRDFKLLSVPNNNFQSFIH